MKAFGVMAALAAGMLAGAAQAQTPPADVLAGLDRYCLSAKDPAETEARARADGYAPSPEVDAKTFLNIASHPVVLASKDGDWVVFTGIIGARNAAANLCALAGPPMTDAPARLEAFFGVGPAQVAPEFNLVGFVYAEGPDGVRRRIEMPDAEAFARSPEVKSFRAAFYDENWKTGGKPSLLVLVARIR